MGPEERPERTREILEGLPVDLLDGLRENARTGRECDCPPYVSRCAHREDFRVWLITREDSAIEYRRRLEAEGLSFEDAISLQTCPKCGDIASTRVWEAVAGVFGPGKKDLGCDCVCRIPFFLTVRGLCEYAQRGDDVDALFGEAVALLSEVAP